MAQQNLDLIPQEEKSLRTKERAGRASFKITTVLFILTLIFSLGVYLYVASLDSSISQTQASVDDKKRKINDKAELEILARNLDSKYKILSELFGTRFYYSVLLDELSDRLPTTVSINSVDTSTPDTVSLTGEATDYISLAKFLNSLADPSLSSTSANTKEENLFTEVLINSVNLDPINSKARFNFTLSVDTELLKKE